MIARVRLCPEERHIQWTLLYLATHKNVWWESVFHSVDTLNVASAPPPQPGTSPAFDPVRTLFLQVQLLVSESDVENYKQIKSDLDELRLLVEKSELWVYKAKPEEAKEKKKKKKADGEVSEAQLNEMVVRFVHLVISPN